MEKEHLHLNFAFSKLFKLLRNIFQKSYFAFYYTYHLSFMLIKWNNHSFWDCKHSQTQMKALQELGLSSLCLELEISICEIIFKEVSDLLHWSHCSFPNSLHFHWWSSNLIDNFHHRNYLFEELLSEHYAHLSLWYHGYMIYFWICCDQFASLTFYFFNVQNVMVFEKLAHIQLVPPFEKCQ